MPPPEQKPEPAHPKLRRTELPWTTPKPTYDDPEAAALIERILESAEYRQADEDVEFLQSDDTRGVRLQLDFLKAEKLFRDHGIAHSIVVFGSTRIPEPEAARRKVKDLELALARDPDDRAVQDRVRIARRVEEKSRYYDVAREFGRIVGRSQGTMDNRLALVTGGGPGLMEAANRGASVVLCVIGLGVPCRC